jgi:hypothetical protein
MKEELQGKLVEILTSVQGAVGRASDFAMAELPDIAQSYIAYGRAYTALIALLAVAVFCAGFWAMAMVSAKVAAADSEFTKNKEKDEYVRRYHYFEASDIFPIPYLPFVLGLALFFINASQLLLVWFAPKVWLLKEIAGMLK